MLTLHHTSTSFCATTNEILSDELVFNITNTLTSEVTRVSQHIINRMHAGLSIIQESPQALGPDIISQLAVSGVFAFTGLYAGAKAIQATYYAATKSPNHARTAIGFAAASLSCLAVTTCLLYQTSNNIIRSMTPQR